ncbi:hypothetical protein ILUMI_14957 [Ignelater luminosus]|uniref:Uncharacterized protein n=1 Tax=Ignelater luminosus TaxID=2038154 RepID=A0A8K0CT91_IGNLU|nr:hypothetical protein ILUMI_14957 [Ignelater luminosus]
MDTNNRKAQRKTQTMMEGANGKRYKNDEDRSNKYRQGPIGLMMGVSSGLSSNGFDTTCYPILLPNVF